MKEPTIGLSLDRKTATLNLRAKSVRMTSERMEMLMRALALIRAEMLPEMPNTDLTHEDIRSVVPCQRWAVELDPDAPTQIRLFLQHRGFGWVWLPLSEANVLQMQDAMQQLLRLRPSIS